MRRIYYTGFVTRYTLLATATFGLESVVAAELATLGFTDVAVENGRVVFSGGEQDVARCNLWLRSADRLLIRLAEFPAGDMDDLYEGVRSIAWADFLPDNARIIVTAHAARERSPDGAPGSARAASVSGPRTSRRGASDGARPTFGVPALQSVGKKAIVDSLMERRGTTRVEETGPEYSVGISAASGLASVTLDTSGSGLHKRGYRTEAGEAPLRETLAAGMVLLSRWDASRSFADPLCGSGTIPIEAALIGMNAAPGIRRGFAAERWPHIPAATWSRAREEAASALVRDVKLDIRASDRDAGLLAVAERNAGRAGAAKAVSFRRSDLRDLRLSGEYGCIVTNPPYAERMGNTREAEELYGALGRLYRSVPTWSLFALCAHPRFAALFGARASKNRKLYNGNIRCYFHQYFGPLPPRRVP